MAIRVIIPKVGDTGSEVVLDRWLKEIGDAVQAGEPLLELSTDKAAMEIEAPGSGILRAILHDNGSLVPEGEVVGVIADAEDNLDLDAPAREDPGPATVAGTPPVSSPGRSRVRGRIASPRAQAIARETQLPAAQFLAIRGSGTGGRILARDVEATLSGEEIPGHAEPLTAAQRIMAARMTQSAAIPQFSVSVEADASQLAAGRQALVARGGEKVSVTAMLLVLIARALTQFPRLNATCAGSHVHVWDSINLAVAVASQGNLLAPVLRGCERKSPREIAVELAGLTAAARLGQLTPAQLSGGTFTVSNLGMLGADDFQPLVNPPQTGILAVGRLSKRPWVDESGGLCVRDTLRFTVAGDHRVVDGAYVAQFLAALCELLRNADL